MVPIQSSICWENGSQQSSRVKKTHQEKKNMQGTGIPSRLLKPPAVPLTCQSNKRFLCDPGISVVAMVRSTQLPVGCLHLGWWLSTCPPPANYQRVRPLKIDRAGHEKERIVLATIHFHVRDVSFREGICFFHWVLLNEWTWTTQPPWIVWLIFGMSHIARGSLQCFRILVVLHSLQQPCHLVQIQQGHSDPLQLMP